MIVSYQNSQVPSPYVFSLKGDRLEIHKIHLSGTAKIKFLQKHKYRE